MRSYVNGVVTERNLCFTAQTRDFMLCNKFVISFRSISPFVSFILMNSIPIEITIILL